MPGSEPGRRLRLEAESGAKGAHRSPGSGMRYPTPALAEDVVGARRVVAELGAEVPHEDVHQVPIGALAPRPHPLEQRIEGHGPSRIEREHAQELVLRRGEHYGALPDRHPAPGVVDGERTECEGLGALVAAERRADPGHELGRGEGLDEVVGRARFERPRHGLVAAVGGDEDDRQVEALADILHPRDAVDAGQHQVEQHEPRALGADDVNERLGPRP